MGDFHNNEINSEEAVSGKDTSRYLSRLYILALSVVALLSLFGQLLVQAALENSEKDASLVNVAGRQRMLSQRIAKLALLLDTDQREKDSVLSQLQEAHSEWRKFHLSLYNREGNQDLAGENSEEVDQLFALIQPNFLKISEAVKNLQENTDPKVLDQGIRTILSQEVKFLAGMDRIVTQYEKEANEKVIIIKRIEYILFVLTILVLTIEGAFIFRPAVKKIRTTIRELQTSQRRLFAVNKELKKVSTELETVNSDLERRIKARTSEIAEKSRELEIVNHRLEKVNKDLDNFVYTASHDLKAPINNIDSLFKMMLAEVPEIKEKAFPILEMFNTSLDNFKKILRDLAETGKSKENIAPGKVRFREILEEVRLMLKNSIEETGAVIQEDFSEAPEIQFSVKNIRSIIFNLLSNSLKFIIPGRTPVIQVQSMKGKENIVLKVKDNGIGIKKEDVGKVFSMYERLDSKIEGTGVGLGIIKKIMENEGGSISVESIPDEGTVFSVYFPLMRKI